MTVTAERVRELIRYEPDTGAIFWKAPHSGTRMGELAGTIRPDGYRLVIIEGTRCKAHRVAWLLVHGYWPTEIDHINGDRADNRLSNLRLATRTQNCANKRRHKNNKSGLKGIWPVKDRWRAAVQKGGVNLYLGYFNTPEEAHAAYVAAAEKLFGEFARAA